MPAACVVTLTHRDASAGASAVGQRRMGQRTGPRRADIIIVGTRVQEVWYNKLDSWRSLYNQLALVFLSFFANEIDER